MRQKPKCRGTAVDRAREVLQCARFGVRGTRFLDGTTHRTAGKHMPYCCFNACATRPTASAQTAGGSVRAVGYLSGTMQDCQVTCREPTRQTHKNNALRRATC
jgi:hypothetical protein